MPLVAALQWGRSRAGAERYQLAAGGGIGLAASLGPLPRGSGERSDSSCIARSIELLQWGRSRAGAERQPTTWRSCWLRPLQWGRSRAGAERDRLRRRARRPWWLQWGRSRAGAERVV